MTFYRKLMMVNHPTNPTLFSISTDFDARLIRTKSGGLWDLETFQLYEQALIREMKKFQSARLPFNMLGDATETATQPQYLDELRQKLFNTAKEMGLRKSALIMPSPLAKLQIRRLLAASHEFFTSEKEALAWIEE